ncbi:MAG: hypothetical protein ACR2NA_07725 [Solirubrobacterales bacterium]
MAPKHTLDELPRWPRGTVGLLATAGDHPHVVPVSTIRRAGPRRVVFALADRRSSLARLRDRPAVSLAITCEDVAISVEGPAEVAAASLGGLDGLVGVSLEAVVIQDHHAPTYALESGVGWRWTDEEAERRDSAVHAALRELAEG